MDTSVGIREFSGLQHSRCSKMQGADVRGARVHSSIFQPWHDVVTCCMSMWGKEFTMKWQTDVFGATSHNHTHPTMSRYRNPGMGGTLVKGKVIMPKVFLLSMFLISRWWCWCTRLTCKTDRSSYTRLTQLIPNMAKSITRDVMASLKPRWTWARDNTTCGRIPVGNDKDKGSIFSQMPPLECSIEAAEPRQDLAVPRFACWPILPLTFECLVPMLLITSILILFVRLGFLCYSFLFHYRVVGGLTSRLVIAALAVQPGCVPGAIQT